MSAVVLYLLWLQALIFIIFTGDFRYLRQIGLRRCLPRGRLPGFVLPASAGICMPRVQIRIEGFEVVVDTGGSSQAPQAEASPHSSSDSFVLVSASSGATPLSGYLPSLPPDSPRASGATRGGEVPPLSSAPYTAEASSSLPPPFPSSSQVPEYPLQGSLPTVVCRQPDEPPAYLLDSSRALSACNLSPRGRVRRAWKAGLCAGKVLRCECDYVDSTPRLNLSNRLYCVLKTRASSTPQVLSSFAEYRRVPGILERGTSVSHAFPSETEARAYFAGAGVAYPH